MRYTLFSCMSSVLSEPCIVCRIFTNSVLDGWLSHSRVILPSFSPKLLVYSIFVRSKRCYNSGFPNILEICLLWILHSLFDSYSLCCALVGYLVVSSSMSSYARKTGLPACANYCSLRWTLCLQLCLTFSLSFPCYLKTL
jgi:hypothetical protein